MYINKSIHLREPSTLSFARDKTSFVSPYSSPYANNLNVMDRNFYRRFYRIWRLYSVPLAFTSLVFWYPCTAMRGQEVGIIGAPLVPSSLHTREQQPGTAALSSPTILIWRSDLLPRSSFRVQAQWIWRCIIWNIGDPPALKPTRNLITVRLPRYFSPWRPLIPGLLVSVGRNIFSPLAPELSVSVLVTGLNK